MENKEPQQNGVVSVSETDAHQVTVTPSDGVLKTPAGSLLKKKQSRGGLFRIVFFVLAGLLLVGGGFYALKVRNDAAANKASLQPSDNFSVQNISLKDLSSEAAGDLSTIQSLSINGQLRANNSLVIAPTSRPQDAAAGQIYYDKDGKAFAYYNGQDFVTIANNNDLAALQAQLTALQGQTSGLQNSVNSLPSDIATRSGSNTFSGTNTFTTSTNLNGGVSTSNLKASGTTLLQGALTVNGAASLSSLAVSGATTLGAASASSLVLSSPLAVGSGGTGTNSNTLNGVLIGQGASPISAVTAGAAGLCLVSTAGAPAFQACPGGGGTPVESLNGLSGALSISNASGSGATITIDDASTTAKGIASFSASNFSVTTGAVSIAAGGIGSAELAANAVTTLKVNDGAITNAKLANSSLTVTAGNGLGNGGSVSLGGAVTLDIASANGGITVNADSIELTLQGATPNGASATTSSGSGLEILSSGLTLLQGCTDSQILKWNKTTGVWACGDDAGGNGVGDDVKVNGTDANGANFIDTAADGTTAGISWSLNTGATPNDISLTVGTADATHAGVVTTGLQSFSGDKTFNNATTITGLFTANGGVTIEAGDTLTFNGDAFTDLTGTGLIAAGGVLQASLGTSIESSEITDLTVTGADIANDTIADAQLAFDTGQHLTVSSTPSFAGVTLTGNLSIGTNSIVTSGATIGSSELDVLDGGITEGEVSGVITDVTAGGGLTGGGAAGDATVNIASANGGITVNADSIELTLQGATPNGASATTSSGSGLEILSSGLTLLQGCTDNQILKWNKTTGVWACGDDAGGSGLGDDIYVGGISATNANFADTTASGTTAGVSWSINTTPSPDDVTVTISNASATQAGVVTTGVQTFAGDKTFNNAAIVSGLFTANGGVTIETGDTLTFNGDAFTDLTGTGLIVAGGILQASLGTSIESSEITDLTVTGADIANDTITDVQLAFDTGQHLTVSSTPSFAGITLTGNLSIGTNSIVTSATTISSSELDTLDNGIDESEVSGVITDVTAGGGLTGGGAAGSATLNIASANGGITVNADNIALTLQAAGDALSATTSSGSGLEILSGGFALLQGCADAEVLKWNESTDTWGCAADAGGTGLGDDIYVGGISATNANFADTTATGTVAGVTWNINTTPSPDDITLTISDASATQAGVVTTGAQSFAGVKTFGSQIVANGGIDLGTQTLQGTTGVIDFNNFDVLANGNTTIGGTLSVTGASTFSGNLSIGTNSIVTSGATIGSSELDVLDGGITEGEVSGVITDVTAGSGLTGGASAGNATVNIASANGGITVNADSIALTLQPAGDALSATTSSGSGLEILSGGLALLQGCINGQLLKWDETTDTWGCADDTDGNGGSGVTSAGGSTNRLAKFTGSQAIGDSTITDDGTDVSTSGNLSIQGGSVTVGTGSQFGSFVLHDGNGQTTTLRAGDSTGNLSFILPTDNGTTYQCLKYGTAGQLIWDDCDGGGGGAGGVTSLNGLAGGVTIQGGTQIGVSPSGQNINLSIAANAITATELATDAVTTLKVLDGAITNAKLANSSLTVAAGNGLADGGSVALGGSATLNIASANGGITVNADNIALTLQAAGDALSATTSSGSGLEILSGGFALLQGCGDGQILKWDETADTWSCAADAGGTGVGDDVLVNGLNASGANLLDSTASGTAAGITWNLNTVPATDEVTLTVSNASATQAGVVTTGAQTFAGVKTFNGQMIAGGGIDLGTQTIQGSTGVIDFSNFDVLANGNTTIGGTLSVTGASTFNGNLSIGTNSIVTSATTISSSELDVLDGGITEGEVSGVITDVTAGGGLTGGGAAGDATVNIASANGGITVNADSIALTLQPAGDALSATTSSGSGLEILSGGFALLQGCGDNQILKWNETSDVWACGDDAGGTGLGDDVYVGGVSATNANFANTTATGTSAGISWNLNTASSPDDVTLTITNASATQAGVVTNAAQTFAGVKTFNGQIIAGGGVDLGAQTLQGTSAAISFTNFSVAGSGATSVGSTLNVTGATTLNDNVTVAANKTLRLTGGTTATRNGITGLEGMTYYDTTTKQLVTFANGKWQGDRADAVYVAASDSSQLDKDRADYLADGDTVAAGDGDQVQVNQALTAASGRKVILLAGTYVVDAAVSVPNNTTLSGVGRGTIITVPNTQNGSYGMITNTTAGGSGTGVSIQDLTVDGNKANQSSGSMFGIYMDGMGSGTGTSAVQGARINNVRVINLFGAVSRAIFLSSSSNNTLSGNVIRGTANGIYLSSSSNNTFSGNTIQGNTYGFVSVSSDTSTLSGNTVQGNTNQGMLFNASTNNTITGNTISGNTNEGMTLGSASNNNNVTGNTVQGNGSNGISISGSDSNTISGNKVHDNSGATANNGIVLNNSDFNSVTGNNITDTSATTTNYAIDISDTASDANNIANNTLGTGTVRDLSDATGGATVFGGQVKDSSNGNYYVQPAGTVELMTNTNITGTLNISSNVDTNGSLTVGTANQFSISNTGVVTSGTWNGSTIALAYGGTNNTTYTTNGIVYSNGSALVSTAAGTNGQCLLANTGAAPTWGTCTATNLQGSYDASSPATISLTNAKDFTINAADTATDSSIVFNLQCATCSAGGGRFAIQDAGADIFRINPNGDILLGDITNGHTLTLSASSGYKPVFAGNARNTKYIRLHAEYPSAVLLADGSNNLGTMTSGIDLTNLRMNYYKWTTTQGSSQDYDVVVQVPIPADFDGWNSNPLSISARTSDTTNGTISVEARDSSDTQICNFASVTPVSTGSWATNNTACTLSTGTYTPGDYMTIRIRLQSPNGGDVRTGNIVLSYKSKF